MAVDVADEMYLTFIDLARGKAVIFVQILSNAKDSFCLTTTYLNFQIVTLVSCFSQNNMNM